jgi:hypothetical protein
MKVRRTVTALVGALATAAAIAATAGSAAAAPVAEDGQFGVCVRDVPLWEAPNQVGAVVGFCEAGDAVAAECRYWNEARVQHLDSGAVGFTRLDALDVNALLLPPCLLDR